MGSQRYVERRRYGRVPVKYRAFIHFRSGNDTDGTLLDLSLGGCRISSVVAAAVGSTLEIRIYPDEGQEPIQVERADVRWAREGQFGVEFVKVAPAEQKQIEGLFESLADGPL